MNTRETDSAPTVGLTPNIPERFRGWRGREREGVPTDR